MSSRWESICRAAMAFPGVFYWDGVQSVQLIMSALKCPKVFGWKLLQTLKKCLIIRAPCPERSLGSRKFTHLLRSLGQNMRRPEPGCDFRGQRGLHIAGTPSQENRGNCVQTALWGDPCNALATWTHPRRRPMPSTRRNTHSNHRWGVSTHGHSARGFHFALNGECTLNFQDHDYIARCTLSIAAIIKCRHKVTVCSCLQLKKKYFHHNYLTFK